MRELPKLYVDNDQVLGDLEDLFGHNTMTMPPLLKPPSMPVINARRFPITIGFLNGAPTDDIAGGIAIGERWMTGPAPYAGPSAIWLSPLDLPYRDQVAAWRAKGPQDSLRKDQT